MRGQLHTILFIHTHILVSIECIRVCVFLCISKHGEVQNYTTGSFSLVSCSTNHMTRGRWLVQTCVIILIFIYTIESLRSRS